MTNMISQCFYQAISRSRSHSYPGFTDTPACLPVCLPSNLSAWLPGYHNINLLLAIIIIIMNNYSYIIINYNYYCNASSYLIVENLIVILYT